MLFGHGLYMVGRNILLGSNMPVSGVLFSDSQNTEYLSSRLPLLLDNSLLTYDSHHPPFSFTSPLGVIMLGMRHQKYFPCVGHGAIKTKRKTIAHVSRGCCLITGMIPSRIWVLGSFAVQAIARTESSRSKSMTSASEVV